MKEAMKEGDEQLALGGLPLLFASRVVTWGGQEKEGKPNFS
jgi:hypothetical protein